MYNIGTVTATANSTKLVGTGTKWKENINLVLPMQSLQIQIGNTVHNNSIHSIQSNTELTLNFPLPASQTGAKYVIFTTTMDSISAAANAIVAMNVSNVQFSDIQNRIMTETGVIDVKLPDGTVRKTRTEAERDKLLDGKVDKTTGEMELITVYKKGLNYPTLRLKKDDGSSLYLESKPDEQPVMAQLYERGPDGKIKYSISFPKSMGTAMQVGDFGVGEPIVLTASDNLGKTTKMGIYMQPYTGQATIANEYPIERAGTLIVTPTGGGNVLQEYRAHNSPALIYYRSISNQGTSVSVPWILQYNTGNTTKDSNGNLKAASPIVKVFADHIELNEESEGVELEKLGTGRYKLKGVLGMNSDASWGGIHGGMVIPNGINNLPLVWGSFDVLPDGDIIIETRYRKHELNERQEAERLMTYPEFLKDELVEVDTEEGKKEKLLKVEREDYEYCDIPNGHWIDVRVNMPSNSIYNLKQAEAERLAKEEAEKQAEEEAKKAELEVEEGDDI
ncbi:pyocin knob domain-containing protein [Providencia manganoxydans]|uniref:pyocin knob domain-containing protein n=1 Tax=Providencia manganoxydans TaxID=2923283 RepID=UPI0034E4D7D4